MGRRRWLACAFLAGATGAQAQPFDWRPVNHQSAALIQAGRFDEAAALIDPALAACPRAASPVEAGLCTAVLQENRSGVLEHAGDLAGAEAALEACIAARTAVLPANHPLVAGAHFFLALFYKRQGRRVEELAALRTMEQVVRSGGPEQSADLMGVLSREGVALDALGRHAEAVPAHRESLALALHTQGRAAAATQSALMNLANALVAAGNADAAVDLVQAALSRPEAALFDPSRRVQLAALLGTEAKAGAPLASAAPLVEAAAQALGDGKPDDPTVAFNLLYGLSRVLAATGQGERAVDAARRARAQAEAAWGPHAYTVIKALQSEAAAETARGDQDAAAARLREAIDRADTPALLLTRAEMAQALSNAQLAAGHAQEAVDGLAAMIQSPALALQDYPDKAAALALLGTELVRLGEFEVSAAACAEATRLAAARPQMAPSWTALPLVCSGNVLVARGQPEQALQLGAQARAALWAGTAPGSGREPALGDQLGVVTLLFAAARDSERFEEALGYGMQQLVLTQRIGDARDVALSWSNISGVQRRMGRLDAAWSSCDAGLAALPPGDHALPRASLLNSQGLLRIVEKRPAEAVPLFEEALRLRHSLRPPEAFLVAEAEGNLSNGLQDAGQATEAEGHLDAAIALYRGLGRSRQGLLKQALLRRAPLAIAAGNPADAEAALRERLALEASADPGGAEAAAARLELADLLDNLAQRGEAATLRQEALRAMTARYGADSAIVERTRLASLRALQDAGQATAALADCEARDSEPPDRLACLAAQAKNALAAGRTTAAGMSAAKALAEAEARWGMDSAALTRPLLLQAEAAAAADDPVAVERLLQRASLLAGPDPTRRAWLACAKGRLLGRAGDPEGAEAALQEALTAGTLLQNADLVTSATSALAARRVASGAGENAVSLWDKAMPQLAGSPLRRITALEGVGDAAASMGRQADAARFYGEAAALSQRAEGAGSARFRRLAVAQAMALSRAGDREAAARSLGALKADPSPAAAFARTAVLFRLANEVGDAAEALVFARQAMQQAGTAFGEGSVVGSFAQLDLAVAQILAGERPAPQAVDEAMETIRRQDPSWWARHTMERVRGLIASDAGQFDVADAALAQAEALLAEHAAPGSQAVAEERANRGAARLARGDAAGADTLYRQALAMASGKGQARTVAWARIAAGAAAVARRLGDTARADSLMQEAQRALPPASVIQRLWA